MDHDKVRPKLSAYKDGELDEGLSDRISRHIQECHACREELGELDQVDSLVRGIPELIPPEAFTSKIVAGVQPVTIGGHFLKTSLPRRILDRFLHLADSVFELLPGYEFQRTGSLDEFGDFPPLSLSHAYFQLIGQSE